MKIFLTHTFKRSTKKLHRNQIPLLETAIEKVNSDPMIGELKTGDLAQVRVYKFHMLHQLTLLDYSHDEQSNELMLLSVAPHENFYENLKKQVIRSRSCSTKSASF